jgi:hypothetical protein
MELSVVDPEEKMLNDRVDKMIGADTNLATIVKMALKPDCVDDVTKEQLIYKIRLGNEKQAKLYEEQFKFTMDCAGNIIEVNNIDGGNIQIETNTGGELLESKGGSS